MKIVREKNTSPYNGKKRVLFSKQRSPRISRTKKSRESVDRLAEI